MMHDITNKAIDVAANYSYLQVDRTNADVCWTNIIGNLKLEYSRDRIVRSIPLYCY